MESATMKNLIIRSFLIVLLGFCGCQSVVVVPDLTPPSRPRGLYTQTGDRQLEIFWLANLEPDLAGYKIYSSVSANGPYDYIGSSRQPHFIDGGIQNGVTYYYAVSAYDLDGNESSLSTEIAYDTPRPEGYDVTIGDYRTSPRLAGYDFSTYSIGPYDDQYTDVFYEYYSVTGTFYLDVWDDTDIRDMGPTVSLYDITYAPTSGWSPTKDAVAVPGHTYVVRTRDNHFAKLRIIDLSTAGARFDWAYQLQEGNPRLKQALPDRPPLSEGPGLARRRNAAQ
jgi:hypothetical protein